MNLHQYVNKTVVIKQHLADAYEVDVDAGMKMVVTSISERDAVIRIELEADINLEYNRQFMKATYYPRDAGDKNQTYEQRFGKPLHRDSVYLDRDNIEQEFSKCFDLDGDSRILAYLPVDKDGKKVSWVAVEVPHPAIPADSNARWREQELVRMDQCDPACAPHRWIALVAA